MVKQRKTSSTTKTNFESRFQDRLALYEKDFDISTLNSSSDRGLLDALIRQELLLENLQISLQQITEDDSIDLLDKMGDIKKFSDLIRDGTASVTTLQRTLSIDRKTRKNDAVDSIADHIKKIKKEAAIFIDKRLYKIYCPNCKIMVGRFSPVHNHTAFIISVECSQCGKSVRMHRETKDIWFDVKDADWRRKYNVEVVQPEKKGNFKVSDNFIETDDDVIIDSQESLSPVFSVEDVLHKSENTALLDEEI